MPTKESLNKYKKYKKGNSQLSEAIGVGKRALRGGTGRADWFSAEDPKVWPSDQQY